MGLVRMEVQTVQYRYEYDTPTVPFLTAPYLGTLTALDANQVKKPLSRIHPSHCPFLFLSKSAECERGATDSYNYSLIYYLRL